MIEWGKGDLFLSVESSALAHGCNCAGAMGKGIAVEFRRRWPAMYEEYRNLCMTSNFQLGDVFRWKDECTTIFCLGTQTSWRVAASHQAIQRATTNMLLIAEKEGVSEIRVPRIGAGLGGLDWASVKAILVDVASGSRVRLLVYEDFAPGQEFVGQSESRDDV